MGISACIASKLTTREYGTSAKGSLFQPSCPTTAMQNASLKL